MLAKIKMKTSSTCFILKLLHIKVLQKFCTYSKEPKRKKRNQRGTEEELKRNQRENQNSPPLPFLSNSLFIKIDPCGIEFAMIILHPHGFGNVVARGRNLCMQLRSQNCEFAASGGENCLAANKKKTIKDDNTTNSVDGSI
jgi:hypothetical protein